MNYIENYQSQLKSQISPSEVDKIIGDLVILNSGVVILDVRDRWRMGLGVNGGIIGSYRWDEYRDYKQSINPAAGGKVDLTLTGSLSEGLALRRQGKQFQVFSTDSKYEKLGKKYGFEQFGLTDEQQFEFFNQLYGFAVETILSKIWQ